MRVAFEIAGVEAVKEAVRAGMGVGFVSAMSLRHDDAALVLALARARRSLVTFPFSCRTAVCRRGSPPTSK